MYQYSMLGSNVFTYENGWKNQMIKSSEMGSDHYPLIGWYRYYSTHDAVVCNPCCNRDNNYEKHEHVK